MFGSGRFNAKQFGQRTTNLWRQNRYILKTTRFYISDCEAHLCWTSIIFLWVYMNLSTFNLENVIVKWSILKTLYEPWSQQTECSLTDWSETQIQHCDVSFSVCSCCWYQSRVGTAVANCRGVNCLTQKRIETSRSVSRSPTVTL